MSHITVTRSDEMKISSVYYKGTLLGFMPDGDCSKMESLMAQALELQSKEENAKWVKCTLGIAKSVYHLDPNKVSEDRMVEIVKAAFV